MVTEKDKLVKQLNQRLKKLYNTHNEGLYSVELKELMDFINNNPSTSQILHDLKNKNKVDKPASMGELARSSLTPIEYLIADSSRYFAYYLQYVSDSGWNTTRFRRMTEGYVDPLITYICYTLENDEKEEPEQRIETVNNFKLMVIKNVENYGEVQKDKRDSNRNFTAAQKNLMIAFQNNKCAGCGKQITSITSEADHKISWESGGRTEIDNGWALCLECHQLKTTSENVFRMERGRRSKKGLSSQSKNDNVKTLEDLREHNPNGISYEFVSNTIPDIVNINETGDFNITLKNMGSTTWDENFYLLGTGDTEKFCYTKWLLHSNVAPGDLGIIPIKYKAPFIPGTYTLKFALRLMHFDTLEPTLVHRVIVKKTI